MKKHEDLKVLDVGCGLKPYRSYFGKIDDYVGIDRSCTAEWTKALDVRASAESIPFKSNLFNIVLCTQVLEHVAFPEQTLKEMYRCLKSDGWLVLSTHGIWIEGHEAVDLWRWTSQGLQKVLSLAGFEIEEVYSMNSLISLFQFLLLYIPTSGVTKHVVFPCINMLARLLNGLLGKSSYFTGDRIGLHIVHFIIASKKKARAILVAASEKRSKRS